ncbi:hypothetical protein ACLKA7_004382 [Drosophila subpalustris]
MNKLRVLRNSNVFLMLSGYQMHWFDVRLQSYGISLAGALNVFVLACIYAGCFAQHFQPSAMLKTLHDVSPFLYGLTRMHLLLTVKVFSYAIYASVRSVGVVNAFTESLPMKAANERGDLKEELIAQGLIYSTHLVLFCFGLYIGYEMEFKLPPLQDAMIGFALFLPHLVLAGALRFYCILAWLTRSRLRQLESQVEELLNSHQVKTEMHPMAGLTVAVEAAPPSTEDNFGGHCQQLQQLGARFGAIFGSLQHSLLLLLGVNGNCLLFGTYACTYYSSTWHVLFDQRRHRIFYAGNSAIFACIACDYVCLLISQTALEQQLQFLQFFIIALIVIYHYLKDAIQVINDNLDSSNDE